MSTNKKPLIIVNKNPIDLSMKIVIPPFRPVNIFEIEDNFESIVHEIERNAQNQTIADFMIRFFTHVKMALESGDILPLVEYFFKENPENADPRHVNKVFAMLEDFIQQARDKNRLMN